MPLPTHYFDPVTGCPSLVYENQSPLVRSRSYSPLRVRSPPPHDRSAAPSVYEPVDVPAHVYECAPPLPVRSVSPVYNHYSPWRTVSTQRFEPVHVRDTVHCDEVPPYQPLPGPPVWKAPEEVVVEEVLPPPLQVIRDAVPVQVWQDVLVNFRRGNFGAMLAMLRRCGPIIREQIIPLLRILRENYRYKTRVASYPVTHWV